MSNVTDEFKAFLQTRTDVHPAQMLTVELISNMITMWEADEISALEVTVNSIASKPKVAGVVIMNLLGFVMSK